MNPLLEVGRTCGWLGRADDSAAIVDASAYYAAFYRAASLARQHILLAGWQFDSNVALLRGEAASRAQYPINLLPFLNALCSERPELRVYILAWDYSLVYTLEREWLQRLKFAFQASSAIRFEFDAHPSFGGSHHQKFAVLDGQLAFVGGLDLCDERWDDRRHVTPNALRVSQSGTACRPNHEVQAYTRGAPALALQDLFVDRWQRALGEQLSLTRPGKGPLDALDLTEVDPAAILRLRSEQVAIARTWPDEARPTREVQRAFRRALSAAHRLIYIETQYFTSRSVTAALIERLKNRDLPRLEIVILLPRGADNSKEKFALGELQNALLSELQAAAGAAGHQLRFLCSSVAGEACDQATFIHSKVLIVDDQLLCIGSANMTERSMSLDSELCLLWQGPAGSHLEQDIRALRASLLAEHSGISAEQLLDTTGLSLRLDRAMASGESRLRLARFEPADISALKRDIFDPSGPAASTEPLSEAD